MTDQPQPRKTKGQRRPKDEDSRPSQKSQKPKSQKPRYRLPYILNSDPRQFELQFYQRYDESYLFNKAVTVMYAIEQGAEFQQHVQTYVEEWQGGSLSDKYFSSLKAELFFMTLHQFEAFFALLIAPFQQTPTWIYLTAYTTDEIKAAIRQYFDGDLATLTRGFCRHSEERKFLAEALYQNSTSTLPEHQARWNENLDNAAWLIRRVADRYLTNLKAYNSYKHGLRTVIQQNAYLRLRPNDAAGNPIGPGIAWSSEEALSFLELKETAEGTTVHETTTFFDPTMSFFYLVKLHQMIETIKLTRLAALRGDPDGPRLNMFLRIDKDDIMTKEAESSFTFTFPA